MTVTPEQRAAIIVWYRQRQALGTAKALARKLGITASVVESVVAPIRNKRQPA